MFWANSILEREKKRVIKRIKKIKDKGYIVNKNKNKEYSNKIKM